MDHNYSTACDPLTGRAIYDYSKQGTSTSSLKAILYLLLSELIDFARLFAKIPSPLPRVILKFIYLLAKLFDRTKL